MGDVVRVQPLGYRLGPWKTCPIRWMVDAARYGGLGGGSNVLGGSSQLDVCKWLGSPPFISHFCRPFGRGL